VLGEEAHPLKGMEEFRPGSRLYAEAQEPLANPRECFSGDLALSLLREVFRKLGRI